MSDWKFSMPSAAGARQPHFAKIGAPLKQALIAEAIARSKTILARKGKTKKRGRVANCVTWTSVVVVVSASAIVSTALLIELLATGNLKLAERVTPADHSHASDGSLPQPPPPTPSAATSPPPPPGAPPPTATSVQFTRRHTDLVAAALDATIQPDYAGGNQVDPPLKHAYGMIGNAFSRAELIVGRGERARGVGAQSTDYVRWSAFTQIVAAVAVVKAVEEGLLGYDDEVRQYLPEMDSANLRQLRHDSVTGLPNGTQPVLEQTTVRHLMTFRSGQTYLLWRQGLYLLPGLFGSIATDEEYIWNAHPEVATKMATGVVATGECPSSDESLLATIGMPLSHAPGQVPRLGNGYAIVGAVLAGALRAKNHTHRSASAYTRARVLDPLGMTETWFARTEDPPADVASRLAEAFLMRMADPAQVNEGESAAVRTTALLQAHWYSFHGRRALGRLHGPQPPQRRALRLHVRRGLRLLPAGLDE